MGKTAVFMITGSGFSGIEGQTAVRAARQLLLHDNVPDIFETRIDNCLTVNDLLNYKGHDTFAVINGSVFITGSGIKKLSDLAMDRRDFAVIAPVSNESKVQVQRLAPPFFYQTLEIFRQATVEIYHQHRDNLIQTAEADNFCLVFKREVLEGLKGDCLLVNLTDEIRRKGLKTGIAQGIYAHRYGNCYESSRDDLLALIPSDIRNALDIGCANGLFGEMLKKRQNCTVTGVDSDAELLSIAEKRLDYLINGDIEKIIDNGALDSYDCIVCGDVLEHLNNPWKVVKGLKNHLKKGGTLIASTPNIMNWAIIHEQLKGRWDYVPFSILSGTHIRFFTKDTCRELFEGAGYTIRALHLQSFGIAPEGVEFIKRLKKFMDDVNEEELRASEIVVVAVN